jgi:plasmid stabilization system protein ParE
VDVVWKARALRERAALHAALVQTSLRHAQETLLAIQRSINYLESHPQIGRKVEGRPADRLLAVPRTQCTVVYRLVVFSARPRLEIMRIVDQRRQFTK